MVIQNDGNVGIGTTSPDEKIHVLSGSIKVESGQFVGSNEVFDGYNGYYSYIMGLSNKSGRSKAMEFYANSNIGHINWNTTGKFNIGNSAAGPLALKTNDTERLTILSGGNVGIGTITPTSPLHLVNSSSTDSSSTGTTLLTLTNHVGGDLTHQKSFIDFELTDTNTNEYPQVRIGAEVGPMQGLIQLKQKDMEHL